MGAGTLGDGRRRPGLAIWLVAGAAASAAILGLGLGPWSDTVWALAEIHFAGVTVAASLCVIASCWVLALGHRRQQAETGLLGAGLANLSLLSIVHGLTAPGVWYGPNGAVSLSVFLAVPVALLTAVALVIPRSTAGRLVARHWRPWTATWMTATVALAIFMMAKPSALGAAPGPGSPVTVIVVAVSFVAAIAISWRHLRMYRVGRHRASLVSSIAVAQLGIVPFVFFTPTAYSPGWWAAHAVDIGAVFAGCFGLVLAYRSSRSLTQLVAPVVVHDPLVALELGLSREIRALVAALGEKDELTRTHVVRVAELAMRAGQRMGLPPERLRALGLAGLLHDIGKLVVPDAILTKPGALDEWETSVIRKHPVIGAEMLASSELLRDVAPLVRWHHERHDGTGYPDGIAGVELPIEVGVLAVADAWDAMTATRHYRVGMTREEAVAILCQGAGSQWSPQAVATLLQEVEHAQPLADPVLAGVGAPEVDTDEAGVCPDALPEVVRTRLVGPRVRVAQTPA